MNTQIIEYETLIDLLEDLDREGIQGIERQDIYKRFLNYRARMRGIPYSGGFELTPLCNFDCKMCYVHLTKEQIGAENRILSAEQWIDIMRQAIDAGMMHADLTGGECLTHPGFKDIYMYLISRGIGISILTNGQLISDDMADLFKKYPPSIVQITVYGSDEDAYEHVTGKRAFQDVIDAVQRLKKRGINMLLTITPSSYMQEDTHTLLELLRSMNVRYGIGTGSLSALPETGRVREDYAPDVQLYAKLHLDDMNYLKEKYARAQKIKADTVFRIPKGFNQNSKVGCSAGQATFHINWKGEMTPCIPFYTVKHDVLASGFSTAWNWIHDKMAEYEPPAECEKCEKRRVCAACVAEKTHGVFNGPINRDVCSRIECYLNMGVLSQPNQIDCL